MTHADARLRLRAYADGTLAETEAEGVRAHIASGCEECLGALFTRPVGLPRVPVVVRRAARERLVAVAVGGTVLGCLVGVTMMRWGERRVAVDDGSLLRLAGELGRVQAERVKADAVARARIDRLEARLVEAERRTAEAPPAASAASERGGGDGGTGWLEGILGTQGTRSVALEPAGFAKGAGGYAVWSPERGIVVVSATGLGTGTAPLYRACVTLSDGATVWVGDLAASEHGTLTVTVVLPETQPRRVVGVDLYRDPPGAPALTARLRS